MELSRLFLLTSVHTGERGHSALGIMELEAIWFISLELRRASGQWDHFFCSLPSFWKIFHGSVGRK